MCALVNRMSAGMSGLYLCFAVNTEMSLSRFVTFFRHSVFNTSPNIWMNKQRSSQVVQFCFFCFLLFQSSSPYTVKKIRTIDGNITLLSHLTLEGGAMLDTGKHVVQKLCEASLSK